MIFRGKVKKGFQKGKSLGFPTANIELKEKFAGGIYVSKTKIGEIIYPSITFIGKMVETYILDFKKDLYGKWISVRLLKKIRKNKKFKSEKDLVLQMKLDELVARSFFNMVV